MGHQVRDCSYLRDRIKTIAAAVHDSDTDETDDVYIVSNEVSISFPQWILDSAYSHHVCYREELFHSLENSESTARLSNGSSCMIKSIEIVNLQTHDGAVRKLGEV